MIVIVFRILLVLVVLRMVATVMPPNTWPYANIMIMTEELTCAVSTQGRIKIYRAVKSWLSTGTVAATLGAPVKLGGSWPSRRPT